MGQVELRIIPFVLFAALAGCSPTSQPSAGARQSPKAAPVRITQFYASPANPGKGEKALLCYGVENATEVRLDPPVERVWPAMARCFDIMPAKEATYTLTAAQGTVSVSQSVTVKPGPPAVKILEVSINKLQIARGEQATVCYKTKNAVNTAVEPGAWVNPHTPALGCIVDRPQKTTTYTVTATGIAGDTDAEHVTAQVK